MVKRRIAVTFALLAFAAILVGALRRRGAPEDVRFATSADLAKLPVPSDADVSETDAGEDFVTLRTLEEARAMEHTAAVMQGGGNEQIYLTVPVKYIGCDEATLRELLALVDGLEWRDGARATLSFELAPIGSGIFGGMGGGSIVDGVWLHPRLEAAGLLAPTAAAIYGRQTIDEIRGEFPAGLPS